MAKDLLINHIDFGDIRVGVEEGYLFLYLRLGSRKPTSNEDFET